VVSVSTKKKARGRGPTGQQDSQYPDHIGFDRTLGDQPVEEKAGKKKWGHTKEDDRVIWGIYEDVKILIGRIPVDAETKKDSKLDHGSRRRMCREREKVDHQAVHDSR